MFKTKKKIVVCMVALVVALFPMTVNANVVDDYYLDYAEPATSDTQGYVSLALQNRSTGSMEIVTFFWNTFAIIEDGNKTPCLGYVQFTSSDVIFGPYANGVIADSGLMSVTRIGSDGVFVPYPVSTGVSSRVSWSFYMAGYNLIGYKYGGNAIMLNAPAQGYSFSLLFAEDGSALQLMQIQQQMQLDALDDIVAEQKKTNTWLEKILEAINGSSEQQKQEATNQGNSSVSQGESAIEDKGAAFGDGIVALTNSMNYTGTDCSWQFPQVKLPAINGVMDEVVLIESQPINFTQWVEAIPDAILLLIRSLLTVALIVYCFKEIYSTIAYVLTLRKDDNT